MSKRISILSLLTAFLLALPLYVRAENPAEKEEESLDVKEIIFEHLGDGYGWEVPFSHTKRMPLPVIVRAQDGNWFCFSSSALTELHCSVGADGKSHEELVPVVKECVRDGKTYRFLLARVSSHKDKVVEIFPLSADDQKTVADELAKPEAKAKQDFVIDGYVKYDGKYFREYRPLDFSITKNVCALYICCLLLIWAILSLVRYYRRKGMKAPRNGMGFLEMLIGFVYYDTIKATLGDRTRKFAPYLLTCFFFILTMNIVGLVVVFPGGANLTGNIAITLVLAVLTFIMTNVLGTKHYWKEIFWPDVPIWLKCPIPIMQMIEVFGIFTKPAALCVRLFANMMGGHMIVITLTLLIFIFAAFGAAVAGASAVISVLFSLFMLALDVLVSFIQAYVFTLLSAMFIAMAQEREEKEELKHDADDPAEEHKLEKELAHEEKVLSHETKVIETV